jgi:predicted ester cyclase
MNACSTVEIEFEPHPTSGRTLEETARARVAAFLSTEPAPFRYDVHGALPAAFMHDLSRGGPLFRAAFPELERRIADLRWSDAALTLCVHCDGEQRAPFYGVLAATGRRVRFDVVHRVELGRGRAIRHLVTLDVHDVLRQLARRAARKVQP